MCLAIPMQVMAIDGHVARCSAKGIEREVSLFLVQDDPPAIGDFVVVHVGYAIQKTTPQEARSAWELYDEMLAAEEAAQAHA
jgi:hydrogenase expression/formation protein HypC